MQQQIKIGIHLPNRNIQDILLSDPEKGNPGIGGTQFLLFSLPYYLEKYYYNQFRFLIFAESDKAIKSKYDVLKIDNLEDAAQKAKDNSCDIFVFRPGFDNETQAFLKKISEIKLKAVAWMHNSHRLILKHLARNQYVVRCVCVSRDQYETLRDHPIITKLTLIYNAVDSATIPFNVENQKTKSVVFLGGLTFAKGFHTVAKMWKKVLVYHPDAELVVIGSGTFYDRNLKLGPLGLAEEKYEKMFSRYILNRSGRIIESIKFLGTLGAEKYEIMCKASAGIANHPDLRETFCLSAIEFQLCGTPVVSSPYGGLLDTVENGVGGFLRNYPADRLKCIVKLLSDKDLAFEMGKNGRKFAIEKFNYDRICKDWSQLFYDVHNDNKVCILEIIPSEATLLNRFRELLRILKSKYTFLKVLLPSIYLIHSFEVIKLKIQRIRYQYL